MKELFSPPEREGTTFHSYEKPRDCVRSSINSRGLSFPSLAIFRKLRVLELESSSFLTTTNPPSLSPIFHRHSRHSRSVGHARISSLCSMPIFPHWRLSLIYEEFMFGFRQRYCALTHIPHHINSSGPKDTSFGRAFLLFLCIVICIFHPLHLSPYCRLLLRTIPSHPKFCLPTSPFQRAALTPPPSSIYHINQPPVRSVTKLPIYLTRKENPTHFS